MAYDTDMPGKPFSDEAARHIAHALMESVRGESLEAGFDAACEVVYNQWSGVEPVGDDAHSKPRDLDSLRGIGDRASIRLAQTLAQYELSDREQYHAVFEALVGIRETRLARAGLSFSSVPAVAEFMVALAGRGRRVLDPACGYGGTLLAAARLAPRTELAGIDINTDAVEFARRRLELAGVEADISVDDWLDQRPEADWDAVIVEPPMGVKLRLSPKYDPATSRGMVAGGQWFASGLQDGDALWLLSVAESINSEGRAVILAPDGVAYRGGRTAQMREALLRAEKVEAIIAMPADSVLGASVATCVWVLSERSTRMTEDHVLLVNARAGEPGAEAASFDSALGALLPWIEFGLWKGEAESWFARPVPIRELIEHGDARPQRHLDTPPERVSVRPEAPGRLLTELRLESFKSVGPEVRVPLRPLTLVYGRNSAGKSSLIQSILLMKQSVDAGRLSAGGPLVNLGSVAGLAHNHDETTPLRIGLSFASSPAIDSALSLPNPRHLRSIDFSFVPGDDRSGALASIQTGFGGQHFRWLGDPDDAAIMVATVDELVRMAGYAYQEESVHPARKASTSGQPGAARTELGRMGRESVEYVLDGLTPHGPAPSLVAEAKHRLSGTQRQGRLEGILRTVGNLFGAVGDELRNLLERVAYLGPLRQAPERLSVRSTAGGSLDVPFFLLDNTSERQEVSERLQQLGVPYDLDVVNVADGEGRNLFGDMAAVVLTDTRTGTRLTPADVGFGISQVLPIVTELSARTNTVILIEQPEIHLHPAMQADLADLLIESIDASGRANQVIAETHSEAIMLRIQRRVREGILNAGDVAVVYVDQDESGTALVHELRLDDSGDFLDSWPHGFFAERFDDVFGGLA